MSQAAIKIQPASPILSVNNIEVVYDEVIQVLRGVSLDVPEGEIVTLLGPNGAGKSTTLKAISGLLKTENGEVTKGDITFMGERIEVFGIIKKINQDQGITMLLVEQNANYALRAANYGYIIESGKVVLDGTQEQLLNNEDVKEFYLGGGNEERKSFKDLKSYKRRKRWL